MKKQYKVNLLIQQFKDSPIKHISKKILAPDKGIAIFTTTSKYICKWYNLVKVESIEEI